MANGIIENQSELGEYLTSNPGLNALSEAEIGFIVFSAVFDRDGRFRGMRAGPIIEKFTGREISALMAALNNPPTIFNHYPGGPDGECIEMDNGWCTDYSGRISRDR